MTSTLTTAQAFAYLNELRTRNGKQPLKAFKESRAKLDAMINAEINASFEASAAELAAQSTRPVSTEESSAVVKSNDTSADTSERGTGDTSAKDAALKAARLENDRKNESLAKLEAEQPSPSAKSPMTKLREAKAKVRAKAKALNSDAPKSVKPKKSAKSDVSAASVLAEFGIAAKIGRALLRKHNVTRTPEAIRAFLKSRKK